MKTSATLCSGGALFDVGAKAAGYTSIWGIEKMDKIAAVARLNGFPVSTSDVLDREFLKFDRPDHLHASPPCPNFSIAKEGGEETELDIAIAQAVADAIIHFRPDTFTLENVVGYRLSASFKIITNALTECGYWWEASNLNAANFGVPQTRVRLWVRASRGLLRGYPPPVKWVGWYAAIEDLIPDLPDTQFAPWQLARLPEEYKTFMIGQGTYSAALDPDQPSMAITANNNQSAIKAFIMQVQSEGGKGYKESDEPMQTIEATHGASKYRAFVVASGNTTEGQFTLRDEDEPHYTVTANMDRTPSRAYTNGRVVKLNVKALGRFQTVPDWYRGLTIQINGNGVPCLMAQKVLETL